MSSRVISQFNVAGVRCLSLSVSIGERLEREERSIVYNACYGVRVSMFYLFVQILHVLG